MFVTTKLANPDQGYESATPLDASLAELGSTTSTLLIHWPCPPAAGGELRALEEILASGRARSIGVSNFQPDHLDQLLAVAKVVPAVNQIELHPYLQQREAREANARHGIATEAYSPLGQTVVLEDPVIVRIAQEHGRTPAQVVLRWHLQLGVIVIPKTVSRERMASNLDVVDFELTAEDMAAIEALDRGQSVSRFHPDTFNGYPEELAAL